MSDNMKSKINEKLVNGENILIMLVGDSITWGLNHCSNEETFCAYLARLFAQKYPMINVLRYDGIVSEEAKPLEGYEGPINVNHGEISTLTLVKSGVGGDTVKRAFARSNDFVGTFKTGKKPDLFLLMFGINDSIHIPEKYATPEEFYNDYKKLYNLIRKENSNSEIVLLTPTYNDSGESIKSTLDNYSKMVKRLANEVGCQVIDTHEFWMNHLVVGTENYGQREWLSGKKGDFCHFSPAGSSATAEFIFNEL